MPEIKNKVALPPGYREPPKDSKPLIEYLGFDPLLELGDLYLDIPEDQLNLRKDTLTALIDRVYPRKTDRPGADGNAVQINMNMPVRDEPKDLEAVVLEHIEDDTESAGLKDHG